MDVSFDYDSVQISNNTNVILTLPPTNEMMIKIITLHFQRL